MHVNMFQVLCDYFITRCQRVAGKTQTETYPYQFILNQYRRKTGIDHTKPSPSDLLPESEIATVESEDLQTGEVGFS